MRVDAPVPVRVLQQPVLQVVAGYEPHLAERAGARSCVEPTTPWTCTPSLRSASTWTTPMKPVPTTAAPISARAFTYTSFAGGRPAVPKAGRWAQTLRRTTRRRWRSPAGPRAGDTPGTPGRRG